MIENIKFEITINPSDDPKKFEIRFRGTLRDFEKYLPELYQTMRKELYERIVQLSGNSG